MPRDMMNDPPMDDLPDPHLFVRLEGFARQAEHYGAKDVLRPNAYWWKKLAETLREVAPHVQQARAEALEQAAQSLDDMADHYRKLAEPSDWAYRWLADIVEKEAKVYRIWKDRTLAAPTGATGKDGDK